MTTTPRMTRRELKRLEAERRNMAHRSADLEARAKKTRERLAELKRGREAQREAEDLVRSQRALFEEAERRYRDASAALADAERIHRAAFATDIIAEEARAEEALARVEAENDRAIERIDAITEDIRLRWERPTHGSSSEPEETTTTDGRPAPSSPSAAPEARTEAIPRRSSIALKAPLIPKPREGRINRPGAFKSWGKRRRGR